MRLVHLDRGGQGFEELRIVAIDGCPTPATTTFFTIGLSIDEVDIEPGLRARTELSISVRTDQANAWLDELVRVIVLAARLSAASSRALVPGTVMPFGGPLIQGLSFSNLYSADMSYLGRELRLVAGPPAIFILWLVPVFESETRLLHELGWRQFESVLSQDPELDVTDLSRDDPGLRRPRSS